MPSLITFNGKCVTGVQCCVEQFSDGEVEAIGNLFKHIDSSCGFAVFGLAVFRYSSQTGGAAMTPSSEPGPSSCATNGIM